jgi:hypothetical protein
MNLRRCAIPALAVLAVAVSGCSSLRDAAGLTKRAPDEFAVSTKAPLVIPPDFNLRPPMPGAPPVNQVNPNSSAQATLFNNTDPAVVAAGMRGNYSMAEKLLLANARAQNSDPGIRTRLKNDQRVQGTDPSFTDRVLGARPSPSTGQPINADAEIQRNTRPQQRAGRPPAKKSGGWFDWF